jgi:hypothetical protein
VDEKEEEEEVVVVECEASDDGVVGVEVYGDRSSGHIAFAVADERGPRIRKREEVGHRVELALVRRPAVLLWPGSGASSPSLDHGGPCVETQIDGDLVRDPYLGST